MAFVTGLLLIDAPASALNNAGKDEESRYENATAVKAIRTREGAYPYVSSQAFKYWLRATLQKYVKNWSSSPVYRDDNIAYTDANPIEWWDDDLLGYMRAPKDGASAKEQRLEDPEYKKLTPLEKKKGKNGGEKELTITRIAPFRVGTLVSLAPVSITSNWESMNRLEGDPIPFSSQFYRATLKGSFSLDLKASGTFSYQNKTGFRNLDAVRVKIAKEQNLTHLESEKSYRLPLTERMARVSALFEGLAQLEGGAKQTLHYTDVMPALTIMAVTKGGNNIFAHVVGPTERSLPKVKVDALAQALDVFKNDILSPVYVGWVKGYLDGERASFEQALSEGALKDFKDKIVILHPREAFQEMAKQLRDNPAWLD